jgi:hypothetical protein
MVDLPVNVTFDPNIDGFSLDQNDDVIRSVQGFRNDNDDLTVEIWGKTTVNTPAGNRHEEQEFQQNAIIEFTSRREFTWRVTRIILDPSYDVAQATTFQAYGREDDVAKYRRI